MEQKIYIKLTNLIIYSKKILINYPKAEKYALVEKILRRLEVVLENLIRIKNEKDIIEKERYLNSICIEMYILKNYIKLSYELKYISTKVFMCWSNNIEKISKLCER